MNKVINKNKIKQKKNEKWNRINKKKEPKAENGSSRASSSSFLSSLEINSCVWKLLSSSNSFSSIEYFIIYLNGIKLF